jgi:hypothetical protein
MNADTHNQAIIQNWIDVMTEGGRLKGRALLPQR